MGRIAFVISAVASVLLFAIGAMLTYEVVARYFFNAPTIWAEELSRLAMIWAVFLGSAVLMRSGDHIRVTILVERLPQPLRVVADISSLIFVAVISGLVAWRGVPIAWDSFERGRTVGSMLDLPSWWSQASIPIGFALMAVQALGLAIAVAHGERFGGSPEPEYGDT